MVSVLSISSLLPQIFLQPFCPASAPWESGATKVAPVSSLPSDFLSCLANGRHHQKSQRQEKSEDGMFIPLVPSLPGCHGCLQPRGWALWVPLSLSSARRQTMGGKGSLRLLARVLHNPVLRFLNPTHTFVNIPFIQFTSIYPIWVHHLFPARILTNRMSSSL